MIKMRLKNSRDLPKNTYVDFELHRVEFFVLVHMPFCTVRSMVEAQEILVKNEKYQLYQMLAKI